MKKIYAILLITFLSFTAFSQGTESFTNTPTATTPASYVDRNWTGDNTLTWTAISGRTDSPTDAGLTGFTPKYIVIRNATGKISCVGINNGCADVTFTYARAYSGNGTIALFINGTQYGTTITVSNTAATTVTIPVNFTGTFTLELRTSNTNRVAIDNIIWTSNSGTPCTEPIAQPTNLLLNATANTISGTFDVIPPTTTVENYLVVRTTSPTLTQLPVDGTTYSIGQTIGGGNGTVVAISLDGTFTNPVSASTQYYFFVFAMEDQNCSAAPNYNQTIPLQGNILTPALAACTTPAQLSPVMLTPSNTSISGTFMSNGASKYLVLVSTSMTPTITPSNGAIYTAGQALGNATIVKYNNSTTFTASGLTVSTPYYIFVYAANDACTGEPFYSSATATSVTTTNSSGPPTGYYNSATGLTCFALKTALYNIIKPTVANPAPTYDGICNIYTATDYRKSDDGLRDIIWDMYSDNPTGLDPYEFEYGIDVDGCGGNPNNPPIPNTAEGLMYNREHSFPRNWFGGTVEPMNSDIMHIFPTDKEVNSRRGNLPYGEVSTASYTSLNGGKVGSNTYPGYTGTVFEPINEYKGDFARAQFYMITSYQDKVSSWPNTIVLSGNTYPSFNTWYLRMLYKWHINDPVSTKEISRNNEVYNIQGNRNPFVDNPQYVSDVWNCSGLLPVDFVEVTAKKNNDIVLINWKVANEINITKYEIERSTDGINFDKIGSLNAVNSPSYYFTDSKLPKTTAVYYNIKSFELDGRTKRSKIVQVKLYPQNNITLYPNPTNKILNINLGNINTTKIGLIITDAVGRNVKQQCINIGQNNIFIDVTNFTSGKYFIKIINGIEVINESFVIMK